MGYSCKIIADSVSRAGDRLTTMEVTFPRIILAEFNTHRVFSRNSASSRAIPLATQLERITQDPFVPEYWGKLQAGMQANEVVDDTAAFRAQVEWMDACSEAVAFAGRLNKLGIHKQLTNRLLEPFMWHTVIVTATEWSNFFALRNNSMAQPEIHTIAAMMQEAYDSGEPDFVDSGKWHLPLIQPDELGGDIETLKKVSAGRCARVSYLTHDGVRDQSKDVELYGRLTSSGHMSPLEHVATPACYETSSGEADELEWKSSGFIGNFRGWKQLRKFIPHENDFSKA